MILTTCVKYLMSYVYIFVNVKNVELLKKKSVFILLASTVCVSPRRHGKTPARC
jgi:hypothetical protein